MDRLHNKVNQCQLLTDARKKSSNLWHSSSFRSSHRTKHLVFKIPLTLGSIKTKKTVVTSEKLWNYFSREKEKNVKNFKENNFFSKGNNLRNHEMNGIKRLPGIKTSEFENTQIRLFINSYIYLLFFFSSCYSTVLYFKWLWQ